MRKFTVCNDLTPHSGFICGWHDLCSGAQSFLHPVHWQINSFSLTSLFYLFACYFVFRVTLFKWHSCQKDSQETYGSNSFKRFPKRWNLRKQQNFTAVSHSLNNCNPAPQPKSLFSQQQMTALPSHLTLTSEGFGESDCNPLTILLQGYLSFPDNKCTSCFFQMPLLMNDNLPQALVWGPVPS